MNDIYLTLRSFVRNNPYILDLSRRLLPKSLLVRIQRPDFIPKELKLIKGKLLLIVCNDGFDQNFPNAVSLIRIGFARGWSEACGPAKLVSIYKLFDEVKKYNNPAIFMSTYDFNKITIQQAKELRKYDLFVWSSVHPKRIKKLKKEILLVTNDDRDWLNAYKKIITAEPKFLWNSTAKSTMYWYEDWINDGFKWISMHPAADNKTYYPVLPVKKYANMQIAYVGGYWKEKAQAFDKYLRPFEHIFYPFGYESWPYLNYSGIIDFNEERKLYSSAKIIPLITGPAGWLIGEITERYFKAPACKAFCIADQNPTLKEIFTKDEMLQAENAEHFHQLVNDVLKGKIDTVKWAKKGYYAVIKKHLYSHRAKQIEKALQNQ